jgi:hypothetical protein
MTTPYAMTPEQLHQTQNDLFTEILKRADAPEIAPALAELLTFFHSAITKYNPAGKSDEERWGLVPFPTPEDLAHFETFAANADIFQTAAGSLADEANPDYRTEYIFFLEAYLELWQSGL